jgi:NAD+ diphosphatase
MASFLHLPLAQSAIDRDYLKRELPDLFDQLWADPATRVLPIFNGEVLLAENAAGTDLPALRLFPVDAVPVAQLRVYLGTTTVSQAEEPAGTPVVLAVLGENAANALEPNTDEWHGLRKTGAGLSARDAGLYAQGLSIANFHASHPFCPKCGMPTTVGSGGWKRTCFTCNTEVFPRTDPAIIVAVTNEDDRILLGSQGVWEENRWSILAGFVEAGESLTAAVIREVYEEAGVHVHEVEYLGSQAWPFPNSLMVGFTAKLDPEAGAQTLNPDGEEIVRLRWFSREEIAAEVGGLILPSKLTIARAIIDHWFAAGLDSAVAAGANPLGAETEWLRNGIIDG